MGLILIDSKSEALLARGISSTPSALNKSAVRRTRFLALYIKLDRDLLLVCESYSQI
jgi:hypothetical protein